MSVQPLIAGYAPLATLGVRGRKAFSASEFVGAARALAAKLPDAQSAMLLCGDRLAFATGLGALLLKGTTALLPPSHARQALARIASARKPAFALVDRPGVATDLDEIVVDAWTPSANVEDVPAIDVAQVAAIVYTSGTTGEPQPHAKSWGSLVRGAAALRERSGFRAGDGLVGAVPPQHMWGLEATVMLPLHAGGIVHAGTPLLPEDIAAALMELREPRWLVATPLHLRSCIRSLVGLPSLRAALTATMALDRALAARFEASIAPVIEIYGSTETGAIATRHPAKEDAFTPLPGIAVSSSARGLVVGGDRPGTDVVLADHAVIEADGRFTLAGRDADLVKVGGKRASLAMLEHELRAIPGVVDAAFALMEEGGAVPRLAALAVAPGMSAVAIVAALRERVDAVFLPRPLHLVDALPRGPLGKLPLTALRERITALSAQPKHVVVPASHPALAGHFPGHPIVPAAWMMTLVADACRAAFGARTVVTGIANARFRAPLLPDTPLRVDIRGDPSDPVAFVCVAGDKRVADGLVTVRVERSLR